MRLSIPAKVALGFAAVLGTFGLLAAFSVFQLHRVGEGLSLVSQAYHPLTRHMAQIEASYRSSIQATDRLLIETNVKARKQLLEHALETSPAIAREKVKAAQAVVQRARLLSGNREDVYLDRLDGLLANLLLRYDEYQGMEKELLARIDAVGEVPVAPAGATPAGVQPPASTPVLSPAQASYADEVRRLKKMEDGIGSTLKDFSQALDDAIDQRVRMASAEEVRSAVMIVGFSLGALVIGLLITVMTQRLLAPIRRLTDAVKDIGEGRFARELAVHSNDDLALLAREFNAMARKLRERDRQLQEKTTEVLRAERLAAVGRLAAQITHEIRNPLSSLSLNTELLQERLESGVQEGADRAEAQALLKSMAREMERLAEITEEYLRFARQPKPQFAPIDLNDAVEELLDFMAAELSSARVGIQRELSALPILVSADAGQIRQLLLNLVRNAREAAGAGGHLRVRTRADTDRHAALVEVEDDGPGVPPELRARLFEPFFTTRERGTGLGLAVVQQIAHEHGGDVTCQAVLPHGTRFIVTLPAMEGAGATHAGTPAPDLQVAAR